MDTNHFQGDTTMGNKVKVPSKVNRYASAASQDSVDTAGSPPPPPDPNCCTLPPVDDPPKG